MRNDVFNTALSRSSGVHQSRDLSGAITATSITPRFLGSFPISVRYDGLSIDVDQDSQVVVDKTPGGPTVDTYMKASGLHASASESEIFEYTLGWQAVSTTRVLNLASRQGVPLHHVDAGNVDAELARLQLPAAVEQRIADAVARPGVEVVTPEREISYAGWTGVGYVVSSGTSTDYRISGGISGGAARNPFNSDPNGPFGPLAEAAPRMAEQVKESTDCDYTEIVLLSLALLMILAVMIALVVLYPPSLPIFMVELTALGPVVDAPLILLLSINGIFGFFTGMPLVEEIDECS
jgi:hypothetical protein